MSNTELEDFKKVLADNNYSEKDFELHETDLTGDITPSTLESIHLVPIKGKITVKRISTNKERTYDTGWNTHWVADFAGELKQGFFD